MSKLVIQSLWIGNELSLMEQLCMASFMRNGHEFHLYAYEQLSSIPEGAILLDANSIIPEKEIFVAHNGSYALFSDWFRWELLYKKGNFWVDMDVVCLKPFHFDTDIIYGFESSQKANVAVLGFSTNHELCKFMADCCKNPNHFLPYDSWKIKRKKLKRKILNRGRKYAGWGSAGGPDGFTKALKHFDLLGLAKPFTFFYPIHSSNWQTVFDETLAEDAHLFSHTHAIHLWNEMCRQSKGFDKNASFPQKSLYEQLKRKYLG